MADEVQYTKRYVNDVLVEEKAKPSSGKPSVGSNEGPKVPTRIIYHGDLWSCQAALGAAKRILGKYQGAVKRSKGQINSIWGQPVKLTDGQTVICSVEGNFSKIDIFASSGGGQQKHVYLACYCDCSFSLGIIVEKTDKIDGLVQTYTVAVCGGKGLYNIFENIIASDFTKYVVDQKVLVMAYYGAGFECCIASGNGALSATGCNPLVSAFSTDSDYWRTTYRIVPFCAFSIPKWIEERVVYGDV